MQSVIFLSQCMLDLYQKKPEEDTIHPITDREHVSDCEKVELDPG